MPGARILGTGHEVKMWREEMKQNKKVEGGKFGRRAGIRAEGFY